MPKRSLVDVSHISSKGASMRITIPKRIAVHLGLEASDIVAFYEEEDGKIVLERLK
ncbi:MAG: AbrB/MazE/SpoVT family DNA-binding domain-containing protein [Candidatus Thermoplasmatota archaeon]|jgi:AbrB family looped-hinge helix DNA binding protein|nr:AbrB/MazE/SpoVT family DNA-binding domain-containing protein [Candidatus Thermoplasmatota archaeon]MCL5800267.1 AbrB/MazE/SpoVT family DNA-binding domain-containing protein [Candidatus Thermoplasmatota archaeon]